MIAYQWKGISHEFTAYSRGDYVGKMVEAGIKESKVTVGKWNGTRYVKKREETIVLK